LRFAIEEMSLPATWRTTPQERSNAAFAKNQHAKQFD
jgi:hypothetical protein